MKLIAIACFGAIAASGRAYAEDWYTLDVNTTAATFSFVEQRPAGPRVWFRLVQEENGQRVDARVLLDLSCADRTATSVEMRLLDGEGRETNRGTYPPNTAMDAPMAALVAEMACPYRAIPRALRRLEPTATTDRIQRGLRHDAATQEERDEAVNAVLAEPGAFEPLTFVHLASELMERGRAEEAYAWYLFGHVRFLTDARAAVMADEQYEQIVGIFLPMYGFSGSLELGDGFDALSDERKRELTQAAVAQDVSTPRYYPLNWYLANVNAEDVAWGYEGSPMPGTDFAIRAYLEAARAHLTATDPE